MRILKSFSKLVFCIIFIITPVFAWAGWDELDSGTSDVIWAVDTYDGEYIVVVGENGLVLFSYDGGDTWGEGYADTTETLRNVKLSDMAGIAVGDNGAIVRTEDSGSSWYDVSSSATADWEAVDSYDIGAFVVVAGLGSEILISEDSGLSWTTVDTGYSVRYYEIEI